MNTTPGAVPKNFYLMRRRILREVLTVVCQLGELLFFDVVQGVGKSHFTPVMVMAIAFAIGGDMDQRLIITARGALQTIHQTLARGERALEGDRARDGAVVKEDRNRTPGAVMVEILVGHARWVHRRRILRFSFWRVIAPHRLWSDRFDLR